MSNGIKRAAGMHCPEILLPDSRLTCVEIHVQHDQPPFAREVVSHLLATVVPVRIKIICWMADGTPIINEADFEGTLQGQLHNWTMQVGDPGPDFTEVDDSQALKPGEPLALPART